VRQNPQNGPRLPPLYRILLWALVRGPGAEFVVGDLIEGYGDDLAAGVTPGKARSRLRQSVIGTCVAWVQPAGMRRRSRSWEDSVEGRAASLGTKLGGVGMGNLLQDIRIALRSLRRRPAFTASVVLTLGLGIGATTTVYSVVDRVVLRPLPYQNAETLVAVGTTFPGREWDDQEAGLMHLAGTSLLNYRDFKERSRSFQNLEGIHLTSILLADQGDGPELAAAAMVSEGFFEALGVSPALGRTFLPEEHSVDGPSAVLVTHGAWLRRFGGDPAIVGQNVPRMGSEAVIVGILPPGFDPPEVLFYRTQDFFLPLQPDHPRYADRGGRGLILFGRLAPGATVETARTEMTRIADELAVEFPDGNVYADGTHFGAGVNSLHAETVGTTGKILKLFLAAALMLLLIAALNSTTLLLARGLDRTQELGVRVALGAGRRRIVRLILVESLALSVLGGGLGILIAFGGVNAFRAFSPASMPRTSELAVDGPILLVALAVSLGSGLAAGLLPALRLSSRGPVRALAGGPVRGSSERLGFLRSTLVGAQVALAVILLSGAGLLFNSFLQLRAVSPGFEPEGVLTMNVGLKRPGVEDEPAWQGWDLLLAELETISGLTAVAGTSNPPYQSPFWAPGPLLPGEGPEVRRTGVAGYSVTPGYFRAMGTRLVSGRGFGPQDGADDPGVAIVNQAFIDAHMEGQDPLGINLSFRDDEGGLVPVQVVGIVENVIQTRAEEGMLPAIYVPYTQTEWPFVQAVVRSDLPLEVLIPQVRQAVARFNPFVPVRDVRTMVDRMGSSRTEPRFRSFLIGSFALVALLLAAAGLYGSLSHAVGRRSRELGIRMALGAESGRVMGMVMRQGLTLAGAGLVVGLIAAVAFGRVLEGLLFELAPSDPLTLLGVAGVLTLAAVLACWFPARRATRVDPVEALRAE